MKGYVLPSYDASEQRVARRRQQLVLERLQETPDRPAGAHPTPEQLRLEALREQVCSQLLPRQLEMRYTKFCSTRRDDWSGATRGSDDLVGPCGREGARRCALGTEAAPGSASTCAEAAWLAACNSTVAFDADPQDKDMFGTRALGRDPSACFCACQETCAGNLAG